MDAAAYLSKALRALEEAHLLLADERTEGACNRAYYAMFDAAHAALRAAGVEQSDHITTGFSLLSGATLCERARRKAGAGRRRGGSTWADHRNSPRGKPQKHGGGGRKGPR